MATSSGMDSPCSATTWGANSGRRRLVCLGVAQHIKGLITGDAAPRHENVLSPSDGGPTGDASLTPRVGQRWKDDGSASTKRLRWSTSVLSKPRPAEVDSGPVVDVDVQSSSSLMTGS